MDLRDLRAFLAVAQDRSFTAAAARLGVGQSALSQTLSRLERELGVALFDRGPRRAPELTPHGRVLAAEARALLVHASAVEAAVTDDPTAFIPLRVSGISSVFAGLMPRIIPQLRADRPQTKVTLRALDRQDVSYELTAGHIDVAFERYLDAPSGIDFELLGMEPLVAAVPSSHPLASRTSVDLSDLRSEAFAMFHRDSSPTAFDSITGACLRAGFSPTIRMYAEDDVVLLSTIASGLVVAVVPFLTSLHAFEGVTYVPVRDEDARTPLSLLRRTGEKLDAADRLAEITRAELHRLAKDEKQRGRRAISFPKSARSAG